MAISRRVTTMSKKIYLVKLKVTNDASYITQKNLTSCIPIQYVYLIFLNCIFHQLIFLFTLSLFIFQVGHPADRQSKVNLYQPDLNLYPMFNECTGYEIVLQPGDVLYIPNLWFHHFENLSTPCISVNFWFKVSTKECAHIIIYYTINSYFFFIFYSSHKRVNKKTQKMFNCH
jgi:hypothetical protein